MTIFHSFYNLYCPTYLKCNFPFFLNLKIPYLAFLKLYIPFYTQMKPIEIQRHSKTYLTLLIQSIHNCMVFHQSQVSSIYIHPFIVSISLSYNRFNSHRNLKAYLCPHIIEYSPLYDAFSIHKQLI